MPISGTSSHAPSHLQEVRVSTSSPTSDGPWHNVDLGTPSRPRASAGFAETAKSVMHAIGSAAASGSRSLRGRVTAAKEQVFDLGSKAKHGLVSAGKAFSRAMSAFIGLFSGSSRAAQATAPTPAVPLSKEAVTEHLGKAYASAKKEADSMTETSLATFLRGNNDASRAARALGQVGYTDVHAGAMIAETARQPPLALTSKAAARDGSSVFADMAKDQRSDAEIAGNAAQQGERFLTGVFGEPENGASISAAAAKVPQPLKDHLRTVFQAIDDSSASPRLKAEMKKHAAVDALFLRTVNGEFGNATGDLSKTPERNRLEMANFSQLMVNGLELGEKHSGAARDITKGFGAKWGATVQAFAQEVAAQGKESAVSRAKYGADANPEFLAAVDGASDWSGAVA